MSRFVILWLTLICAFTLGAQTHAPAKPKAAAAKAATPAGISDAQLEKDIRARFAASKINADKFEVHVTGGVAIIDGRTDVIQHKGTATRLAHSAGATHLQNRIQISEAARDKAVANLNKSKKHAQVKKT